MAKKASDGTGAPLLSADQLLEKRVDSMMDPNAPAVDKRAEPVQPVAPKAESKPAMAAPAETPGAPIIVRRGGTRTSVPVTEPAAESLPEPKPKPKPESEPELPPIEAAEPVEPTEPEAPAAPAKTPSHSFDTPLYDREAIVIKPLDIDTEKSDAAIDDIVAEEADQVLAAEDAGLTDQELFAQKRAVRLHRGHPVFWFIILLLVIVAVLSAYVLMNPNVQLP